MHTKRNYLIFGLVVGIILILLPSWFEIWGKLLELGYHYIDKIIPQANESFLGQLLVIYSLSLIIWLISKILGVFSISQNWKIDLIFYSLGVIIIFGLFLGMVMIAVSRFQLL